MPTITKRLTSTGQPRYRVKIRLHGHPTQSATFRTKTDAKRWAQDTESAIRHNRYFQTLESERHTVADLIDRYTREVAPRRPKSEQKVASMLRLWREELGPYTLADATPAMIAEVRDKLAAGKSYRGCKRKPATCNRYLGVLSHVFTIAVKEWGWVESNPVFKVQRFPEPRGRVRFLSDDERERLLAVCRANADRRLYPLVICALCTGPRAGEPAL